MRRPSSRGFTLIEIMIVILIIGILLIIVLPNMVRSKYQAQWNACGQYERTLAAAVESYNAQEGSYPSVLSALTSSSPVYITLIPTCPSNGVSYQSTYLPGHASGSAATFDMFTIYCPGSHFLVLTEVQQGFPQYNPQRGLLQFDVNH